MAFDYDLIVIGAGSGGTRAARIAASHGARVAIVEEFRVGGTCVIRGCVPKKLMVYASQFSEAFEDAAGFGWRDLGSPAFDWPSFREAKAREIERLSQAYVANLKKSGVEILMDRATVAGPEAVRLENAGRTLSTERILIATGGTPNVDARLPGAEHVITSNEVFGLEHWPDRVVVAGGGYIAVEFAGIFNGLGVDTTLIYRGEEILRGFDDDLRTGLREEMEKRGVRFVFGDVFTGIARTEDGLVGETRGGLTLAADEILFAIGRRPATAGLGLAEAGVELDPVGAVIVDRHSRSSVPSIYAVGDVTNRVNLTPVAIREGHAFADTVFGGKDVSVDHADIATAVFSQPELGTVGLTEAEARATFRVVDVYRTRFRPMLATLSGRDEKVLMKLVVDGETDRVLGVHVMGHGAGEMSQLLGIAVKMGATKADFDRTVAVHPTAAEELVTMRMAPERHVRAAAE